MSAISPIRSVADRYSGMDETEVGKVASGGYGPDRRKQFHHDLRELCRLAKLAEIAVADGRIR